jgi:DNA-binding NtrC family response regulator
MATSPGRALRVLVADDEHVIADTLATIFRNNGFEVRSVYSGYSAIETAVHFYPDVIVSDILMSGINGIDAALSISRELPKSRFVLITGHADCDDDIEQARARGLKLMCFQKPILPQSLIEYLADCALDLNLERNLVSAWG